MAATVGITVGSREAVGLRVMTPRILGMGQRIKSLVVEPRILL
jgi:hypothetical protein